MEEYYDALLKCGNRYAEMLDIVDDIEDYEIISELRDFISLFIEQVNNKYPLMKLNRWLGYIQGCLITNGITTVTDERDWTRGLFRPLDFS